MRYAMTYINITKEKRYRYVIVILNIGGTSFFTFTRTWSHRKGASSPAPRGEWLVCPWWMASSSGLTGDSTNLRPLRRSSAWINSSTFSTASRVPQMLPFIPSGARIMPPETRWRESACEEYTFHYISNLIIEYEKVWAITKNVNPHERCW